MNLEGDLMSKKFLDKVTENILQPESEARRITLDNPVRQLIKNHCKYGHRLYLKAQSGSVELDEPSRERAEVLARRDDLNKVKNRQSKRTNAPFISTKY
ncbi:hypothetical protein QFC20_005785 [Naganishia adeliensis]|uniref:Uncharacterized protein n=1 Tax=Naganishia adeliensis TaxID=92952 RepID=A0ACC2VIR7_9TREE|nr:hypothetical protein QFC20_005785 [Naganishia adeliensis]